jgi:hypothetical protein
VVVDDNFQETKLVIKVKAINFQTLIEIVIQNKVSQGVY